MALTGAGLLSLDEGEVPVLEVAGGRPLVCDGLEVVTEALAVTVDVSPLTLYSTLGYLAEHGH